MSEKTILEPVKKWAEETFLHTGGAEHAAGWNSVFGDPLMKGEGAAVSVNHLLMSGVVLVIILVGGLIARRRYVGSREDAVIPEGHISIRNLFEAVFDFILDTMTQIMGEEKAKRYFPLIIAITVFILISNLLGLVPGFVPPTQNLNTTAAMSVSVFIMYNLIGVFAHGISYFREFFGPVGLEDLVGENPKGAKLMGGLAFIIPFSLLMLVIESINHAARPLSLAVRLTGNMGGDHAVLGAFGEIANMFLGAPVMLQIPIMFLGLIVAVVQTIVFAILSVVYIAMAVQDEH